MKLIKTPLLVLLLLNACITSLAQTGRDLLITNNGDTLRGTIKAIENYSKSLSFQGSGQSEYKNYNASHISFALHKSGTFQSVIIRSISEERIFLQVLALGKINLYKGKDRYYLEKDSIVQMLTKKDTVINNVHKADKTYVGHLNVMMRDGGIPIEKINATRFNDGDLSRLVMLYNQDKGSQVSPRSFEEKEEPSFSVAIKGGLYSSTLKYRVGDYSGYTFDPHSGSLFGIYAMIPITNQVYIQPEIYFVSKGGVYSHPLEGNYGQRRINFDYLVKSSQLSLNLRYNIGTGRFTPYMLGGFCFAMSPGKPKTYRQLVYDTYTVVLPYITVVSEIGYRGAIGMNYKLSKTWQISVEGLFEHTRIHTKDDDFYCNGFGLLANIGYSFGSSSK